MKKRKTTPQKDAAPVAYPIRINRYLYLENICSRRQADRYITQGLVFINKKEAHLGDKVEENDIVTLDPSIQKMTQSYIYLAYNKPRGIVSHNPQGNEKSVHDVLQLPKEWRKKKLVPIGRLDKESEGLMILSDDGRIVDRLLNPKFPHEKEYIVTVGKNIPGTKLRKMEKGINIEGYITKPSKITAIDARKFKMVLTEGKKHQIRRMCAAIGFQVKNLRRVRIKNIHLGKLKENQYLEIAGRQKEQFLQGLL